ncbi:glycosyltransferase [Rhypophila sp. PSN 637]
MNSPTSPVGAGRTGLLLAQLIGSRRFRLGLVFLVAVVFLLTLAHKTELTGAISEWDWPLPSTNAATTTTTTTESEQGVPEPKIEQSAPTTADTGDNTTPQDPPTEETLPPVSNLNLPHYTGPSEPFSIPDASTVDWSQFAYTQYVTNTNYLCNSVMVFELLHRLGSRADRLMMYPKAMLPDPSAASATTDQGRLIIKARDEYNVKLAPITVQSRPSNDQTWAESFTKLLALNQTQYSRVLSLDSDSTILQSMDELFFLPPCPLAIPRAYWLYPKQKILSSQIMLIQPSAHEFNRIMAKIEQASPDEYDMEIINYLYADSALILPHRPYDLLTSEFRQPRGKHEKYLGNTEEEWDAVRVFNEAKFLHFSDWPVPKPWLRTPEGLRREKEPKCEEEEGGGNCVEREIWNGIYSEFRERRGRVCYSRADTWGMSGRRRRRRRMV